MENVCWRFFFSSLIVISSSCPCLFRVKAEVYVVTFSRLKRAFRETSGTIDWFAFCRLERYHGSFATISAFSFKHSFLERVESPLLDLNWNWKCKFSIVTYTQFVMDLKVSVLSSEHPCPHGPNGPCFLPNGTYRCASLIFDYGRTICFPAWWLCSIFVPDDPSSLCLLLPFPLLLLGAFEIPLLWHACNSR